MCCMESVHTHRERANEMCLCDNNKVQEKINNVILQQQASSVYGL